MVIKEIRIFGLLMAVLGTVVFMVAMFTMQESWRAGIPKSKDTKLVTGGIYKVSRNPAFLGFDLVYIGMGMTFFNIGLCVISVMGVIMMHLQILEEEKFLEEVFGKEYVLYREKTGRYIGLSCRKK
ncbi:MAG: isoprenylcysteine carboxylmethyltransferase family protein [Lachnospiraceae bacterium]|nr:isoprenylcysteine carboxylmethyltransferase family protein [Lachnospiraceae bacterium]